MREDPLRVTQSTIATFTRCPRKWYLGHYRRLERDEYRSPLVIGNLVHDALAAWYANEIDDPARFVQETVRRLIEEQPEFEEEIRADGDLAELMVVGYVEWLEETGADSDLEVIEPERALEVTLVPSRPNPLGDIPAIHLLGKLDAKVRRRDGWTAFLEHKSVGNFVDLPAVAQIDRQLLGYDLLEYMELLEHGDPSAQPLTAGAILNMLKKVKRTSKAKPPFYKRVEVQHNVEQLRNHWRHVVAVAFQIMKAEERLDSGENHHSVVPPVPTYDCRWSCSFFTICGQMDDGSDVEAVITDEFHDHDPLERYAEKV